MAGNLAALEILWPKFKDETVRAAASFLASKSTVERRLRHEAKMAEFRGKGPDPPTWLCPEVVPSFNPLLDDFWLPWAQDAQYVSKMDLGLCASEIDGVRGIILRETVIHILACAVPTQPVLNYMVSRAPGGKIAELGSGTGFWAALLHRLGADIVAVDNFTEFFVWQPEKSYFPTLNQDAEKFVKNGGADGRALFLCWPHAWNLEHKVADENGSKGAKFIGSGQRTPLEDFIYGPLGLPRRSFTAETPTLAHMCTVNFKISPEFTKIRHRTILRNAFYGLQGNTGGIPETNTLADRCLAAYKGDTIFFVGELDGGCTFDMAAWVERHAHEGWRVEKKMEIPCWPGYRDVFLCCTKRPLSDYAKAS